MHSPGIQMHLVHLRIPIHNPTYTPSADDLNAGSVQFELIAIAEGTCNNNASASMTITFTNATSGTGNIIGMQVFARIAVFTNTKSLILMMLLITSGKLRQLLQHK